MSWQENRKRKYEERKRDRLCVDCAAGLMPENKTLRCFECTDRIDRAAKNNPDRVRAAQRRYLARFSPEQKEARRKYQRDRYARKKASGICPNCSEPCKVDSIYCAKHEEMANKSAREYQRKKHGWEPRNVDVSSADVLLKQEPKGNDEDDRTAGNVRTDEAGS